MTVNGSKKVLVVGSVKEMHEALLTCQAPTDVQRVLIVSHEVHRKDSSLEWEDKLISLSYRIRDRIPWSDSLPEMSLQLPSREGW